MKSSLINIRRLDRIMPEYESYLNGEGRKIMRERKKVDDFLKVYLFEEEAIESLDKEILKKLIDQLWVFSDCQDKEYILHEMLKSSFHSIKENFKLLIDENKSIAERFDEVNKNIRMIDQVALSEILSYYDKNKYAIWDDKIIESLAYLGVPSERLSFGEFHNQGRGFELYCDLLNEIVAEITHYYPRISTVSDLGFFLLFITGKEYIYIKEDDDEIDHVSKTEENTDLIKNKEPIIKQVLQMGSELGFETDSKIQLTSQYTLDATWQGKIANVVIIYAFEVIKSDARVKPVTAKIADILRLDPTIQKVIIISSFNQYENVKDSLREHHISENSIGYLNVNDLNRALSYLESLKGILDNIGLMKFNG